MGSGGSASGNLGPIAGGYSATVGMLTASTAATLNMTMSASSPPGATALQSMRRRPRNVGGQNISPIVYFTITSNTTVAFGVPPSITVVLPYAASSLAPYSYVAYYDPTANPQPGWVTIEPLNFASGNLLDFEGSGRTVYRGGVTYYFVVFTVTSALPIATPSPTPTATPTPTPTPPLTASPTSLAFPANGSYGAQTVRISGGTPPYTLSVADPTLAQASIAGSTVTVLPVLNAQTGQYDAGATTILVTDT
ncbi:MAG: hypothetical protein QOD39_1225, partial [Mycobacterium sp.]|nr:hypothetical protein [Mycobacterium sp.]